MRRDFINKSIYKLSIAMCLFFCTHTLLAQTPVAVHGQLSITGNRLKDKNGNNYQLRGMSLFWSNWQGKYWNYDVIKWLRDDWNCNVVRAAMGISPDDNSGYLGNPEIEKHKMFTVIEAAIDLGIYVVVDWHSHKAQDETEQAKAFFAEVAQKYGSYPNIIYETYNEPVTDWNTIKTYHNAVIPSIRQYDTKNVIILGTPFYSQEIETATSSPVAGSNLCYALHYYAATHTFWNTVGTVSGKGYYVFVSEFGTCDASGAGSVNTGNSNKWWDVLDQYGVSWCNWAVSDVNEAAACVKPGTSTTGGWTATDLTESGTLVRNKLRGYAKDPVPTNIAPYITASPKDQSVPYQSSATFSVEVAGPSPFTYKWYFKDKELANSNAASYTVPSVTEADTGSYYVVITNAVGSTQSKHVRLDVRYRSTYYASPLAIPGVIQFEEYDKGGQNIGYYDASFGNSGKQYRTDDVDIEAIKDRTDEYSIGFTDNGEWLAYTVNVGWDGDYTIDVYCAAQTAGGQFSIELDGKTIVPTTSVAATGGWFTYKTFSATATLTQGKHLLKYNIVKSGYNIDFMEFKSKTPPNTAPIISINPKSSSIKVGKTATFTVSANGAVPMTYQWYFNKTKIDGATAATYEITSVSETNAGDYYVIVSNKLGADTSTSATLTVQNTNAYQGVPALIPGRVFAKNFDEGGEGVAYHDATTANEGKATYRSTEAVDLETCSDGGSAYSIGYIVANEWLEYSVSVQYTGTYKLEFRLASNSTGGMGGFGVNCDGLPITGAISAPVTGDWQKWETVKTEVNLTAGAHVLRFKVNQGDFNFNYMDFTAISCETNVSLAQGWNLFTLPLAPSDASVAKVFSEISGVTVKSNNKFYRATQDAAFNSLVNLEPAQGYLVYNPGDKTTITISGTPIATNPTFNSLATGWNIIGISAASVTTNSLDPKIMLVKDFDSFYEPSNAQSSLKTLSKAKAYFVKSK